MELNIMTNEANSMNDFLEDYDVKRINSGDILKGRVIDVNDKEVMVNINYAFDGVITKEELTYDDKNPLDVVKKDDEITVYVISPNDGEGYVLLSRVKALRITQQKEIEEAFKNNSEITVVVKETVKGGLVAYYGGIRIFIPGSQAGRGRIELDTLVGKELSVKIIELDFKERKVIASRRVIEEEIYNKEKKALWASIKSGEKRQGTVTRIVKFGAFVDLGGVEGLIHLSDLAWERVNNAEDVVSVGDKVEVFVAEVDEAKGRIALVLKDALKEPWKVHGDSIKEGDIFEGKVTRLAAFGAFVEILPGIEGLVHITEITDENIAKPSEVLKVSDRVKVKVLNINKQERRISLSIKEAIEGNKEYMSYNDGDGEVTLGDLFKDLKL
jgi:small subunit ribosomal protein S1